MVSFGAWLVKVGVSCGHFVEGKCVISVQIDAHVLVISALFKVSVSGILVFALKNKPPSVAENLLNVVKTIHIDDRDQI